MLHEAGARAAVTARLELILTMDVPPLLEIARTHDDSAYSAEIDAFVAEIEALPERSAARPDPALTAALAW